MEENKYQRGKIYKIISPHTNKIYIGSTTEIYLSHRLAKHKNMYKLFLENKHHYTTIYELLKLGDVEIVLIETYPCCSKDELHKKERYYIELNKDFVVNKFIPSRKMKEYYQDNKDVYLDKSKKYYEKNKEQIKEKYKEKYNCECGSILCINEKIRHLKTKKHTNFINL